VPRFVHPGFDARINWVTRGVLIVDDHAGFRSMARALLESEGVDVVGEVAKGEDVVQAVGALHPDVVLLDVHLPGLDGFAVAELLAAHADGPAVVLTSSRSAAHLAALVAASPADGFIAKHDLSAAAIDAVLRSEADG
jgi:DNA-binding NarL/FixJ family response regulator